ncbi:hypothetical protein D3C76_1562310 [compost metagenome]
MPILGLQKVDPDLSGDALNHPKLSKLTWSCAPLLIKKNDVQVYVVLFNQRLFVSKKHGKRAVVV